jgi:hypothetical protein
LTFRAAEYSDYLNSYLRQHVLSSFTKHEIDPALIRGSTVAPIAEEEAHWILTDENNALGKWQDEEAMDHWKGRCYVFPLPAYDAYLVLSDEGCSTRRLLGGVLEWWYCMCSSYNESPA